MSENWNFFITHLKEKLDLSLAVHCHSYSQQLYPEFCAVSPQIIISPQGRKGCDPCQLSSPPSNSGKDEAHWAPRYEDTSIISWRFH